MQAQVLPKELRVTAPPTMPQARSYLFKQQSTLSTYNDSTNVIQINLPRLQRSYLTKESYLRFLVNANFAPGTDTVNSAYSLRNLALDQVGAYGLIDKIEIYDYLGSTLLESTAGHGQLMSLLMDLDASSDERRNHFNMIAGTAGPQNIPNQQYLQNVPSVLLVNQTATFATTNIAIGDLIYADVTIKSGTLAASDTAYIPKAGDLVTISGVTTNTAYNVTNATIMSVSQVAVANSTSTWQYRFTYIAQTASSGAPGGTAAITVTPKSFNKGLATGTVPAIAPTGDLFYAPATATNTDVTVTREYTIPLFSFLGSLSDKFAPLHNGYTIMITLNTAANAFNLTVPGSTVSQTAYWNRAASGSLTPYNISNVYFEAQILELGPVAESMLLGSTGGQPLIVPTKAFRNYVGTVAANTTSYRLDINLNVASLTNLLWIQRLSADLNNISYRSLSQRVRNYLQSWYFQYGSSILPQTSGITCTDTTGQQFNEAYCELLKARHSLLTKNFDTVLSRQNFAVDTPGVYWGGLAAGGGSTTIGGGADLARMGDYFSPFESGKFACGIDLELVTGKSGELICGMNTNGMNTSIFLNFLASAAVANTRLDLWAEYDAFINISPGLATTVSF